MKKLFILALCLCQVFTFSACGNADKSDSSQTANQQTETSSADTSSYDIQIDRVTVTMDSINLHEGVEFDDSELLTKTSEFYKAVMESGKVIQPDSREPLAGGDWLRIDITNGPQIYFESGENDIVRIGAEYYSVPDAEAEYKQYVISFLETGGYWGDSAVITTIAEEISCVAFMDTTYLHDGVTVSDPEFIQKAVDFKEYVLANGTKFNDRPDNVPKGAYLNIKLDEENSIYIAASDMTWTCINNEYYEIGNEKIKEFYDYANAYLKSIQ